MPRAAVCPGLYQPLEVLDLELDPPGPGELLVSMRASGVCHSDLSITNGTIMAGFPMVLGHEGAGVVESVGAGVTGFAPGDHIVVSWVPQCGECFYCSKGQPQLCETSTVPLATGGLLDGTTRFRLGRQPVRQMTAAGTFSEQSVIPAIGAVKIPNDIPFPVAALLGCGVLTGVGAALNTAPVRPGDSVAVLGCGGVGLNVVQGARIAGAAEIIAIDRQPEKLELAARFGATTLVDASTTSAVSGVMKATQQRGVDVAFEVIGIRATIEQALTMTRRGGQTVLVGLPSPTLMVEIPAFLGLVLTEKVVKGCWFGSSDVRRDVPRLLDLYQRGELRLDELVTRTITLDEVNDALADLESGHGARSVIVY